jgi:hypothetical protein
MVSGPESAFFISLPGDSDNNPSRNYGYLRPCGMDSLGSTTLLVRKGQGKVSVPPSLALVALPNNRDRATRKQEHWDQSRPLPQKRTFISLIL